MATPTAPKATLENFHPIMTSRESHAGFFSQPSEDGDEPVVVSVASVDDELVAYLDGELSPEEAARIDRRLSEEAAFRERLRELQQAWDMLDLIPRSEAPEAFTRSTVEMIAVTAADDANKERTRGVRRKWLRRAGIAAAVVAAAAGGFALAAWKLDEPNRQLLADLPVLVDLNLYRQAESTAFLNEMQRRRLFADAPEEGAAATGASPGELKLLSGDDAARRRALGELPQAEIDALRRKKTQFDALELAEQERLRKLQQEVAVSPEATQWRELMERYNEWLKTISSAERAELRDLSGVARADKVAQLIKAQEAERFAALLEGRLGKEDLDKISDWLDEFVREHEEQILAALPSSLPGDFRKRYREADDFGRRRMLIFAMLRADPREGRLPRPSAAQVVALKGTLSEEAQQAWDAANEGDSAMLPPKWIAAALWSKAPPPVSEEELRKFFKSRDAKEREWLERLPPERMAWELRRLYYRHKFQDDGRGARPGPRGIGPPQRDPSWRPPAESGKPLDR
jgi:hypothetical protein